MPERRKKAVATAPKLSTKVLYPEPKVEIVYGFTADMAKKKLGWATTTEKARAVDGIQSHDEERPYVTCTFNQKNRPITPAWVRILTHRILNQEWELNLEPLIFGKTGQVISAQHRLFALIEAKWEWEFGPGKFKWQTLWKTEPTIDTAVAYGHPETERAIITNDTGMPRTLWEVIARGDIFKDFKTPERKRISKSAAFAVDFLWRRTAASDLFIKNPGYRSHSDSIDFITRHPRLLECVKHIWKLNGKEDKISRYVTLGRAAALQYMMGAGKTDYDVYHEAKAETAINWDLWDEAQKFWEVLTHAGTDALKAVRHAPPMLTEESKMEERVGVIVKGWLAWLANPKSDVEPADVKLKYGKKDVDGETIEFLKETPSCGGIDLGNPKEKLEKGVAQEKLKNAEIQKRIDEERAKKQAKTAEALRKSKAQVQKDATAQALKDIEHAGNGHRAKGEVGAPDPVKYDADGKPPAPKMTRPDTYVPRGNKKR
jgi:hypothetical protein